MPKSSRSSSLYVFPTTYSLATSRVQALTAAPRLNGSPPK
jgi:hypothetical protein